MWLAFLPSLGVFRLYGRPLLATGHVTAYGLATILGIVVHCNTVIIPEYVHCELVSCGVKYIHSLVTALGIVIRCNTAIRPESIHYALMTSGHVFFCCPATTLGLVVHCDTTIRPESVRCVLTGIRLLPICYSRFRKGLVSGLRPEFTCQVPTATGLIVVRWLFVVFC